MNLNFKNYKHISFDLWLTLIKSNPEFKSKRNQLFKSFFNLEIPIEEIAKKIRYYDVVCNNINEKVGLNIDTFEIYYFILNSLDVALEKIDKEKLQEFYLETEQLFLENKPELIYKDIKEQFESIKKEHITMSILSNTGFIKGQTLRKILRHYEIEEYFSFQIYSDECHFSKPNNSIFERVFSEVNKDKKILKSEILHVGDNIIADYRGAKKFGFNTHLIQ